ncbi:hypothetical protein CLV63_104317 [Murinocardiopsis flavida]|uniref:CDP-glycerol:poly(Glycerophosphate) glycerophosphotransferase n=1 Tax=Murinocardiopsis flavida TaxID=645275 RepID=A0A2P8DPH3_9ACTN|nr:hypothetical protein [Murinocardiopsis flavida]PSK99093.1 hypothetical protein CLV63_104317 [Murinocardiopsis flavida]
MEINWGPGPYGVTTTLRSTYPIERVVLFVAHHPTAVSRLLDVAPMVEEDPRVQVVFTVPDTSAVAGPTVDLLHRVGARLVPWRQARSQRFDAAVSAALGGLEQVHAPVLALAHGHGPAKMVRRASGDQRGPDAPRELYGAAASALVDAGRVIPAIVGVAHERIRDLVASVAPEAGPVTEIVGDPAFDRLRASMGRRAAYRRALGVRAGQRLVVASSTWGPNGLLGSAPDLPRRLAAELPRDRYRTVVVQHPAIKAWHGGRSVAAWLAPAQRAGAGVLPPEEGWRAALVAADVLVADHSSVTMYGAGIGRPVLLGAYPADEIAPDSLPAVLAARAPHLHPDAPLAAQVAAAVADHDGTLADTFAAALTSAPGDSMRLIRDALYRLMDLAPPSAPHRVAAVPVPRLTPDPGGLGAAGVAA